MSVKREVRACHSCGQNDNHPRHVWVDGPDKHMDCCAADGCADGSCNRILDHAGPKRGLELAEHIAAHNDEIHAGHVTLPGES